MKLFGKEVNKDKFLYGGLIFTFIVLYAVTAFVSFYHAITFFNIANAVWLSVLLSFVAEIGQASVLFAILLTDNKHKFLPWAVMVILTSLQVIGNVVSSYDWIITHNGAGVESFQKSILFWMTSADPEIFKVVIAWISGALLPIIALSMTALVAQNMELRAHDARTNLDAEPEQEDETPVIEDDNTVEEPEKVDAKDLISEVSKIRPTEEDIERLQHFLDIKKPKKKEEIIEEIVKEEAVENKVDDGAPFDEPIYNPTPPIVSEVVVDENENFNEPEEIDMSDENDDFGPVDLTKEEPDELFKEEKDYLDKEAELLIPEIETPTPEPEHEVIVSHTNGLIDNIIPQLQELEESEISEEVEPEPSPTPSPTLTHGERLTPEQLERIRQIAKDNLKKK